jgi:CHAT domain-containing protein/Tfp pilus assembly protein PilF
VTRWVGFCLAGTVAAVVSWSACGSSPDPAAVLAEADRLRLRPEKEASQRAIEKYRGAMTAWVRSGDRREAAVAGQRIGAVLGQLGSLRESAVAFAEALPLAQASGDRRLESDILSDLGTAEALLADRPEVFASADTHCQKALDLARRSGDRREVAKALACRGDVEYYRQQLDRAIVYYQEALQLREQLGDQRGRAETERLIGAVYSDLSELDRAQQCYQRSWSVWTSIGDKREQAITLVHEGRLHVRRGEYQDALNTFEDAVVTLRAVRDPLWEGGSLTGIAAVYREMGNTDAALKYYERAQGLFETAGLNSVLVDVLMALGETYLDAGDDSAALLRFERALAIADGLHNSFWQAWALRFIGVVHLIRRQPDEARQYFERSLERQRSLADPRLEAEVRADLGSAYHLLGRRDIAVENLERANELATAAGDRATEARALFGLAQSAAAANDLDAARGQIERSLKVTESLRSEVESRDLRASYTASVFRYHELHMDVLMRQHVKAPARGLAARAFEANEEARARSLIEGLTQAGVDLRKGADQALLNRESTVKAAFEDWARRQRRLSGAPATDAAVRSLADEHRDLEERYVQIQAEIRSKSPGYAALARPQPLSLTEVQRQILDADTLLLEYALGEERSYLWAVSDTGQSSYVLPPRAEIEDAARHVYALLTAGLGPAASQQDRQQRIERADAEYRQDAARLSDTILGPVAGKLARKRLLIVPDGALHYVPFAALPVPGPRRDPIPLAVEHEVVGLPSASALAMLRRETAGRRPPPGAVAVLADPVFEADDPRVRAALRSAGDTRRPAASSQNRGGPLATIPSRLALTRREADAIVSLAPPGSALKKTGFDASLDEAMAPELGRYRVVHFATHGVFDNDNPDLSGIYLSLYDRRGQPRPGFLGLHDIYGIRLPVELVVLSACNTALGKLVRFEGLVGVVRGFMYAGARRVVASLWTVDDEATAELMRLFYLAMFRENRSPASALRQAQLAMRQQERWRAPFYWAGFVLQGEWK